jgi:hypothetical protein
MKKRELTVEEIVSLLRHSSVPTILVEGSEDVMVYRWLKQHIKPLKASAIQCGGREKLLSVYKRRNEFSHIKTAFLADQDMYVFLGIPSDYSDIIWTAGYSIENDFKLKLRGKILFKVLSVYLNARKRVVKYKSEALYEIGAKPVNKHPYMKRLILEINQKLGNQK